MAKLPRPVKILIEAFERLPGIGPKSAARLTFYLLHVPQEELERFATALINLKKQTVTCKTCFNISEKDPCTICADKNRSHGLICLVEQPIDILAIESAEIFSGVYHVLNGAIDPLNNIGPDEIKIYELMRRLKTNNITELILATNPSMEGEATAMYVKNEIEKEKKKGRLKKLIVTRLAHGLPVGADIEFSDSVTLSKAIEGRREY